VGQRRLLHADHEQTGGSGIAVPGRGFILNNELTDFSAVYDPADPNRIQPGKRPRSSISPTIVLRGGKPYLALGSPGGSTIITTVLQTLTNRFGPRHDTARGDRRTPCVPAQHRVRDGRAIIHRQVRRCPGTVRPHLHTGRGSGTSAAEIGALEGLEFLPGGAILAAAEPTRRGGGSAATVKQLWP